MISEQAPSPTKPSRKRKLSLPEIILVLFLFIFLLGLFTPFPYGPDAGFRTQRLRSIRDAKQIKSALDLYASDFDGAYPSDQNRTLSSSSANSATNSEFYFNALIERGFLNEEKFYDKTYEKAFRLKRPDNNGQLDPGENVWGYIKGLTQQSSGRLPLVFSTPIQTQSTVKFSKKTHDGKIIIARLDGSTVAETIAGTDKLSGCVRGKIDGDTVDLFAPENLEGGILVPANLTSIKNNKKDPK